MSDTEITIGRSNVDNSRNPEHSEIESIDAFSLEEALEDRTPPSESESEIFQYMPNPNGCTTEYTEYTKDPTPVYQDPEHSQNEVHVDASGLGGKGDVHPEDHTKAGTLSKELGEEVIDLSGESRPKSNIYHDDVIDLSILTQAQPRKPRRFNHWYCLGLLLIAGIAATLATLGYLSSRERKRLTVLKDVSIQVLGDCVDSSPRSSCSNGESAALKWFNNGANHPKNSFSMDQVLKERLILSVFYYTTGGFNWINNGSWISNSDHCEWYGIACKNNSVEELNLLLNDLSGSLHSSIGQLANLQSLGLEYNQLTYDIPTEVGYLTNLSTISLTANKLTGDLPTQIGKLTMLKTISLGSNLFLTGTIPTEIGELEDLTNLILEHNKLTGSIPSKIGTLTNLQQLHLNDNLLTGTMPESIYNLTELRLVDLHGNKLEGYLRDDACRENVEFIGDCSFCDNIETQFCCTSSDRSHPCPI